MTLSLALLAVVVTGLLIGVVIAMIREGSGVVVVDGWVARWASTHVGSGTEVVVRVLTMLGSTPVIVVAGVATAVYGLRRWPGAAVALFLIVVIVGQFLISNAIKFAVDRARPAFGPSTPLPTPSFPSGHATAAAATFAAIALIGRDRSASTRSVLVGMAVGLAVAVACTRVLLGVHWSSDVVVGLLFGWSWFGVCAIASGGRLLWFAAPVRRAEPPATAAPSAGPADRVIRR